MRRMIAFLCIVYAGAASAQYGETKTDNPFDRSSLPGRKTGDGREPLPKLFFRLLSEVPLPGPLPGIGPRVVDDRIEIPVAGGLARTSLRPGALPTIDDGAPSEPRTPEPWALDPDRRRRYRALPEGYLLAERRCKRCRDGWRKIWRLRVPGISPAAPRIGERHVYFGALDNRVYAVKRRNGHRVWSADVSSRVREPLVLWRLAPPPQAAEATGEKPIDTILVVPEGGSRLLALRATDGRKLAGLELTDNEGEWVSIPTTTPEGALVVARQKYNVDQASLMVYTLAPVGKGAARADAAGD